MGFFTRFDESYNEYDSEWIDESKYETEDGLARIAMESMQFEHEIFTECVCADIEEVRGGYYGESTVLHEGLVGDIYTKIKKFLQKVWNKTKAFFRGFYAKFLARITSDNRGFYNKYKKVVEKNRAAYEMKVKYIDYDDTKLENLYYGLIAISTIALTQSLNIAGNKDATSEDVGDNLLKQTGLSYGSLRSDLEDEIPDEDEVSFGEIKNKIEEALKDGKSAKKKAERAEKDFMKSVKALEKMDAIKKYNGSDPKNAGIISPFVIINACVYIMNTATRFCLDCIKKGLSQARKIYAKAVAYRESYDFDEDLHLVEADALS